MMKLVHKARKVGTDAFEQKKVAYILLNFNLTAFTGPHINPYDMLVALRVNYGLQAVARPITRDRVVCGYVFRAA